MRRLDSKAKVRAANALAIASAHLRASSVLVRGRQFDAAISRLYYAAYFGAQAALADNASRSKRHGFWIGEFHKRFGRGGTWLARKYPRLLSELFQLRDDYDYSGAGPSDGRFTQRRYKAVYQLLKVIEVNTPLLHYAEFFEGTLLPTFAPNALEFDYYCPRSYFHKERMQLQMQAADFVATTVERVRIIGRNAMRSASASRQGDYVLGWNSRLGQDADKFLIFLDLDTDDLTKLKQILAGRKGWLFASGDGFHFVGRELLASDRMWRHRLSQARRAKDLKKVIDDRHIEFSLRRGYSTLRMTTSKFKPFAPFMCWDNT
jgi:uncharacterized protein (UPF0332 family)